MTHWFTQVPGIVEAFEGCTDKADFIAELNKSLNDEVGAHLGSYMSDEV